jgi:hypothetical protein
MIVVARGSDGKLVARESWRVELLASAFFLT